MGLLVIYVSMCEHCGGLSILFMVCTCFIVSVQFVVYSSQFLASYFVIHRFYLNFAARFSILICISSHEYR